MEIKSIGFIGTGMMGHPMALRLIDAGYHVIVWNRTPEKAIQLVERGAERAASIKDIAGKSDAVISMVTGPEALKQITSGDEGVMGNLNNDGIHIDMSTIAPSVSKEMENLYTRIGKHYIQAPVLGSVPQATDGTLLIFAGGERETTEILQPVFDVLGKRTWRFDRPEQAAIMKLACNLFIASMINTLGEGLLLMKKSGIDGNILLEILNESALGAPMYQTKGKSLLERKFTPRFMVRHMEKDLTLIQQAAHELGVPMPAVGVIHELFLAAITKGYGEEDYSAMVKVLEEMAGEK